MVLWRIQLSLCWIYLQKTQRLWLSHVPNFNSLRVTVCYALSWKFVRGKNAAYMSKVIWTIILWPTLSTTTSPTLSWITVLVQTKPGDSRPQLFTLFLTNDRWKLRTQIRDNASRWIANTVDLGFEQPIRAHEKHIPLVRHTTTVFLLFSHCCHHPATLRRE